MEPASAEPVRKPPASANDDFRIGDLLGKNLLRGLRPRVAIVGFPSDEGIRRNGGRQGAAKAPAAIREELYRLTPDARSYAAFVDLLENSTDLGDTEITNDLRADQERLGRTLAPLLNEGVFPIVLGGGHETAFGHFLGYAFAGQPVSAINWDAHPDVRPTHGGEPHSGSPFYEAILHPSGLCRQYIVAGLAPHSASLDHLQFIRDHGGRHVWQHELSEAAIDQIVRSLPSPAMASFDMDAIHESQAPGVSAPTAMGIDSQLWLHAAQQIGRSPAVTSVDLVELSPQLDRDKQTVRLAALTVWSILSGLADRRRPTKTAAA
jgi:formiminoglutamase